MAGQKIELGPTGRTVADNIKRVRSARSLNYVDLSRKMGELGRPISPLAVRRIEEGDRRVDADDLMAFAVALDVPPNSLLLPHADPAPEPAATATGESDFRDLWLWADGEMPLSGKGDETATESAQRHTLARPILPGDASASGMAELRKRMNAAAMEFAVLTHDLQNALEREAERDGND